MRAILRVLAETHPVARTALRWETPFQLLVATILSAQCTDLRVNAVTPALFAAAPDPAALRAMPRAELEEAIRTCGLFRAKARNLHETARLLGERHAGLVPADRAGLEALPGVGRKTASVVLSNAFATPAMAVDTHVFRVARRLGLARGTTPRAVEEDLTAVVPEAEWTATHHRLILHGRTICLARRPRCEVCPLTRWCDWYRTHRPVAPPGAGA